MRKRIALARSSQRGAVAIMLGLSVLVLFGFLALVVDLGRTYVVRTELQNAADAAALAGAVQLNQTAAGVDSAVTRAIEMAKQNYYKFSSPVVITIADLSVGSCPEDSCMVPASSVTTNTLAAGKTFLRVNIPSGALTAFFAQIPTTAAGTGTPSTSTFGRAVAGHFVTQVMPIGVCAIDLIQGGRRPVAGGLPDELTEFGFRRGIAYNIPQLNPLGGSSALPMWLNPLNAPPAACNPANASTAVMRPFVCTGSSTVVTSVPGLVYVNTGVAPIPMQRALNSRFDDFSGGGNACDPASAPPDINIRPYDFAAPPRLPHDWMDPGANTYPSQQTISLDPVTGKPYVSPPLTTGQYGALWSYSRAVRAVGASPNATAGTDFVLADWSNLYANNTADITASGYPASATPPYYKTSGKYFLGPPARPGRINRRVLNVAIVDCSGLAAGPGLACATLPVLGVGKFFMQTPAFLNGPNATLDTEFSGLLTPFPDPTIRLYK